MVHIPYDQNFNPRVYGIAGATDAAAAAAEDDVSNESSYSV